MAKFITGNKLNLELEMLLEKAKASIILISPFIKLHPRYESALRTKLNDPDIEVLVVFGKNEEDISRSMAETDFNFFKQFPNIQIKFEKRLHAKYFANESYAILSSMNLYSFSQDNNIEAGILIKGVDELDKEAWKYFRRVIDQSELLFERVPEYESTMLGLKKKYSGSVTTIDKLTDFFSGKCGKKTVVNMEQKKTYGYCIRTGKQIPFNVEKPLSEAAFNTWNSFKDYGYPANYCHFTGEPSNGETSFGKPILRKNWNEARKVFDF